MDSRTGRSVEEDSDFEQDGEVEIVDVEQGADQDSNYHLEHELSSHRKALSLVHTQHNLQVNALQYVLAKPCKHLKNQLYHNTHNGSQAEWCRREGVTKNGVQIDIGPYSRGVAYAFVTCDHPGGIRVMDTQGKDDVDLLPLGEHQDGYLLVLHTPYRIIYNDKLVCVVCPSPPSFVDNDELATYEVPFEVARGGVCLLPI